MLFCHLALKDKIKKKQELISSNTCFPLFLSLLFSFPFSSSMLDSHRGTQLLWSLVLINWSLCSLKKLIWVIAEVTFTPCTPHTYFLLTVSSSRCRAPEVVEHRAVMICSKDVFTFRSEDDTLASSLRCLCFCSPFGWRVPTSCHSQVSRLLSQCFLWRWFSSYPVGVLTWIKEER